MSQHKLIHELFTEQFLRAHQIDPNILIKHITSNSRTVVKNTLFLACLGVNVNGSDFIKVAIEEGASLVLTETKFESNLYLNTAIIFVPDLKALMTGLFSNYYDIPLKDKTFIGITGTNGKTSVAHMLSQIMHSIYVGTIGIGPVETLTPTNNTTPSIETLMPSIAHYHNEGFNTFFLEISSHALEQKRVKNLPIKTAVFTNLSHEHLDYHGNMEAYANSKYQLFLNEPLIQNAVIFLDDSFGEALVKKLPEQVNALTYGMTDKSDLYPLFMKSDLTGSHLKLNTPKGILEYCVPLMGDFNALNSMAAIGVLLFEDWPLSKIKEGIENLYCISGRMEKVKQSPTYIVDYAHTPDALEKALISLKPLCQGNLWCIFGCGGDRDPSKRSLMGKVAEEHADHIVLTNDNPRNEAPLLIIEAIKKGLSSLTNVDIFLDRKKALQFSFDNAKPDDVILVAGKGHEDYQIIGDQKKYFSDQNTLKNIKLNCVLNIKD